MKINMMWDWRYSPMMGWGFNIFGWIFAILWWAIIIVAIVALIRWLGDQSRSGHA